MGRVSINNTLLRNWNLITLVGNNHSAFIVYSVWIALSSLYTLINKVKIYIYIYILIGFNTFK